MNVLVLGGCGQQGRAALYDLSRNASVDQITCADIQPELVHSFDFIDKAKIETVRIDANDKNALASQMDEKFDVVIILYISKLLSNLRIIGQVLSGVTSNQVWSPMYRTCAWYS